MKKVLISVAVLALLAACGSNQPKEDTTKAAVEDRTNAGMSQPQTSTSTTQPAQQQTTRVNPLTDPNNVLSKRSIYYDYDSFVIKDQYKPIVQAHAKYLSENKNAKATVSGNTDERGSREYNLALGQKRADSVKRAMTLLGASDSQIETTSFGEERPKAPGHDESAWAENRRSDISYAGE